MNNSVTHNLALSRFYEMIHDKMKLCGYRPHTIKAYIRQVQGFIRFRHSLDINKITQEDARNYLNHLVRKGFSRSTIDQAVKAIEILFYELLEKRLNISGFKRPKKDNAPTYIKTT